MRPSMQLSAVSTPAAIWLCDWPVVLLSIKVRSLSRSANSRLSLKLPLQANFRGPGPVFMEPCQAQGCAPTICTGPEYGTVAEPVAPNKVSPALNPGSPNCVEAKERWTPAG